MIDYNALAQQNGAISSIHPDTGVVDYNTLAKQSGEVTPIAQQTPSEVFQPNLSENPLIAGFQQFGTGAGKAAAETIRNVGKIGTGIQKGINSIAGTNLPVTKNLDNGSTFDKATTPSGGLQKLGYGAESVAEVLNPSTIDSVASLASKTKNFTKTALLGRSGIEALNQVKNPIAKSFIPAGQGGAGKTFDTVVSGVQKAVDSFTGTSKAELQAVKQAIPKDIIIPSTKITEAVNNGILKSIQNTADYHGVQGEVSQIFKTPDALVHSGLLSPEEVGKVKGMVNVVKNWSDTSARGILNLKEQLAPFYKDGFNGSNNILRGIQNNLKDLVGEVHPEIKPALAKASANIDKAEEFTSQLLGKNPTSGESKLISIAKNLENPALRGYQHTLLDQLKTATGHDAMQQLKGYSDYLSLLKKDLPSKTATLAKSLATGPAAKVTGAIAGAGLVKEGLNKFGL